MSPVRSRFGAVAWFAAAAIAAAVPIARAQDASAPTSDTADSDEDLASPERSDLGGPSPGVNGVPKLTFGNWFSPKYNGERNRQGDSVVTRGYFPWRLYDVDQLTRISIPYTLGSPGKSRGGETATEEEDFPVGPSGLDDIELYNVALFKRPWATFSFGPAFSFPTGAKSGLGKKVWTVGPAFGINKRWGDWKIGAFSQNFFAFAGTPGGDQVSRTKLQPIIGWTISDRWSVGTSDMNFTYDWTKGRFVNIPVGGQIGKSFKFAERNMKISVQAERNFATAPGSSAWTFRLTWEILLPNLY